MTRVFNIVSAAAVLFVVAAMLFSVSQPAEALSGPVGQLESTEIACAKGDAGPTEILPASGSRFFSVQCATGSTSPAYIGGPTMTGPATGSPICDGCDRGNVLSVDVRKGGIYCLRTADAGVTLDCLFGE